MMSDHEKFHHPYVPYDIQKDLMKAIYECLEDGKVGIFESPTGELDACGTQCINMAD